MKLISSLIIMMLLCLLLLGLFLYKNKNQPVVFVDKPYMQKVVNTSAFFQRMSVLDLKVRNASTVDGYRTFYMDNIQAFTDKDKSYISELVNIVNNHTSNTYPEISKIPWKFAKVSTHVEAGYPHTLDDVIVLSDVFLTSHNATEEKAMTLLHEKIHIYQRKYPYDTHKFIMDVLGMNPYTGKAVQQERKRNNPDINNISYGKNNFYITQLYDANPSSIADSKPYKISTINQSITLLEHAELELPEYIKQIEHPYEIMACYIPPIVFNKEIANPAAQQWLRDYF